jgi:hypothetical protein
VAVVDRLKLCLLVGAGGLGLLALAAVIVLTNTVALVIILAISVLATIVFLVRRWSLAEGRRTKASG